MIDFALSAVEGQVIAILRFDCVRYTCTWVLVQVSLTPLSAME